jgi:hypothetical protein
VEEIGEEGERGKKEGDKIKKWRWGEERREAHEDEKAPFTLLEPIPRPQVKMLHKPADTDAVGGVGILGHLEAGTGKFDFDTPGRLLVLGSVDEGRVDAYASC